MEKVEFEDAYLLAPACELLLLVKQHFDKGYTYQLDKSEFHWRKGGTLENTANRLNIFHESASSMPIGTIGCDIHSGKFFISNDNITDGRSVYRHQGQFKESKHIKNIVRVAKKTLAPLTFQQIMRKLSDQFNRQVTNIGQEKQHEFRKNTHIDFDNFCAEIHHMIAIGYEPLNTRFKHAYDFIKNNDEVITKFHNYDPNHTFVFLSNDKVLYKHKTEVVPRMAVNRSLLPEHIVGKMAVLDITDTRTYMDGIGLKENDNAYWILDDGV